MPCQSCSRDWCGWVSIDELAIVVCNSFLLIKFLKLLAVSLCREQKTKPTQTTVKELRATGLSPDFLVCRASTPLEEVCLSFLNIYVNSTILLLVLLVLLVIHDSSFFS